MIIQLNLLKEINPNIQYAVYQLHGMLGKYYNISIWKGNYDLKYGQAMMSNNGIMVCIEQMGTSFKYKLNQTPEIKMAIKTLQENLKEIKIDVIDKGKFDIFAFVYDEPQKSPKKKKEEVKNEDSVVEWPIENKEEDGNI